MRIHKCGIKIILITLFTLFLINYLVYKSSLITPIIKATIQFISLALSIIIIYFFRNPERKIYENPYFILSPADGKIIAVKEIFENEFFNEKRLMISIFMSLINVHKNWLPASGKILYIKHYDGKFKIASKENSYLDNEHNIIVMENTLGRKILIRQVAGKIARRICSNVKVNDKVKQGNELGFIKFGSRVDVVLPLDAIPRINIGDKVFGSLTVLADLYEKNKNDET